MKRHLRFPLVLIVLVLSSAGAFAQQRIPSPKDVLGFTPGDDRKLADWKQITDYFTKLSQSSPRITLRDLGKTTNGNPFLLATITSPENQKKLDRFREIQHKLADPRLISNPAEVDKLIEEGKNVVVISCSIHSTEIVASQMSMELAYRLTSDNSPDTKEILDNTIILLFPSMNPDGIDIVSHWYQKTLGTPYEGSNPPEIYHHYAGHDDNRDWYMLNLVETQMATKVFYKEWFPEIFYDIHQQGSFGSRMFVPPFFDPPNPNIDALLLRDVAMIGEHMSADLAAAGFKGISTFSTYDTWWHGGFRTAPYYHNAVGILTEAASTRIATPIEVTKDDLARSNTRGLGNAIGRSTNFPDPWPGGAWRNADIRDMEMTTAWSLLKLSARYRREWMRNFYNLGRKQVDLGKTQGPFAYVISPDQRDGMNVTQMVRVLERQGVEVHYAKKEFTVDGQTFASGTYIIPMDQPYRANVKTLFEAQEYPTRLLPNGEAERPYDVAGWTLPMLMGVNYSAASKPIDPGILGDEVKVPTTEERVQERGSAKRIGLYQSWNASMDEGWTRYVLEHATLQDGINVQFHYSTVHNADIRGWNLRDKFDVIILPSENNRAIMEGLPKGRFPDEYTGGLGQEGVAALKAFVEAGGILVCLDQSTEFAIQQFKLPVQNALDGIKSDKFYCPGSVLRISLDTAHKISNGMPAEADAYFVNSRAFEIKDEQTVHAVAHYTDSNVLRSGWLLGEKYLAGKTAIVDAKMGKGHVILFGFPPQFRGQTVGTYRLFFNAIQMAGE